MNPQTSALSLAQFPARTIRSNAAAETRPNSTSEGRAAELKQLLLNLSKDDANKDFRSILRKAADSVREKAFGYNRTVTKRKIVVLLREFDLCEMEDFLDEIKVSKKEIHFALEELVAEGKITIGRRRRWQEPGKHYNTTYELVK